MRDLVQRLGIALTTGGNRQTMARRWRSAALIATITLALDAPARSAGVAADAAQQSATATPSLAGASTNRRPVFSDEAGFTADVSADGRFAVVFTQPYGRGTNEAPSKLEIRDLSTRTVTVLQGGPSPAGTPGRPAAVFSPDARRVVYSWLDERLTDTGMLQVITVANGTTRTLIPADPTDIGVVPHGWSPDGTSILVLVHGPSNRLTSDPTSIAWVSVADGAIRTIKTLEPWRGGVDALPRLSPDGRWITYSAVPREGSTDRYIYVMDANGRFDRAVATMAGASTSPVWTPDSSRIVFRHVLGNRNDLFAVSVVAGRPVAVAPVRLDEGFDGEPIRITTSGALFYRTYGGGMTGLIAERAPDGGRVLQEISGYGAAWRGNTLAYIRGDRELVVRSLDTGGERTYQHTFLPIFPPRLLRDGSAAIVYVFPGADDGRPGGSFYRVDFGSGEFKRLFGKDTAEHQRSNIGVLSNDDRMLYLGMLADGPRWSGIVGVDLATGNEGPRVSFPEPGLAAAGMALSPDGTTLAFHAADGRIVTMRLDGREYREVHGPSAGGGWRDVMRWSPDGRFIVFATRSASRSSSWRLLRVAATGGQPEDYGLDSSILPRPGQLTSIDLSPDGSRVAVGVRTRATFDVAVLENPLPDLGRRR